MSMPPTLLSGEALPGLNQSLWPLVLWAPTTVPLHLGRWDMKPRRRGWKQPLGSMWP